MDLENKLDEEIRILRVKLFNIYPECPPGYCMDEKGDIYQIIVKHNLCTERAEKEG